MTQTQVETSRPSVRPPQVQAREVVNGGSRSIHMDPQTGLAQHVPLSSVTGSRAEPQAAATRTQGTVTTDPPLPSPSPSDDIHQQGNVIHSAASMAQSTTAHQVWETSIPGSINPPARAMASSTPLDASERSRTRPETTGDTMEMTEDLRLWSQPVDRPSNESQSRILSTDRIESPAQHHWPTPPASNSGSRLSGQSPGPHSTSLSTHGQQSDPLGPGLLILLPSVTSRLEMAHKSQYLVSTGHLEGGRLALLQDACMAGDAFYLAVHQIFCLATSCPAQQTERFRFNKFHLQGFGKLAELILPNTNLQINATRWFSRFPGPLDALLERSPIYRHAFQEACSSIERLGQNWEQFKGLCLARRSPPLVDYIEIDLSVKSKVLQHVIYTAIQRLSWIGHQDGCFQRCDKVFLSNQEVSQRWNLRRNCNNPPSKEEKTAYYQDIIGQYQRIQIEHLQHTRQGNQVYMPPFQNQSPSTTPVMGPPQHNQSNRLSGNLQSPTGSTLNPSQLRRLSTEDNPSMNRLRPYGRIDTQTPLETNQSRPTIPTASSSNRIPSGPLFSPDGRLASTNGSLHQPIDHAQYSITNPSAGHHSVVRRMPVVPSSGTSTPLQSPVRNSFGGNTGQAHSHNPSAHSFATPLPMRILPGVNSPSVPDQQNFSAASPPTGLQTPSGTHLPAPPTSLLIPPVGYSMPHVPQPELYNLAMHQAHVRDPDMIAIHSLAEAPTDEAYYQYLKQLACMPVLIEPTTRVAHCTFSLAADNIPLIPKDVPQPRGAPSQRKVRIGSCIFRLRCIALRNQEDVSSCQWALEETTWPGNVTITFNAVDLEIRRKSHYGKDLPIDLTPYVKEGDNKITVAVLRVGQTVLTNSTYVIAVEVICVGNLNSIMNLVRRSEGNKVQELIHKQASNKDPEVEVVGSSVAISVVDPFSLSLIKLPARGESCRHYECFDLELFLQTRQGSPCKPEQFRCPICNGDARPQVLIIDAWFERVLDSIRKMGRPDTRSIVVEGTGEWRIQEERIKGESGDGTGLRRRKEHDAPPRRTPERSNSEVIVID
ncbi:hypothetical protein MMC30_003050 [Trapelia coarctata]|nr:hypothetical protein [Trapelia coarctata]